VAAILQGGLKDHSSQELAFTITNMTQDTAMDCNTKSKFLRRMVFKTAL